MNSIELESKKALHLLFSVTSAPALPPWRSRAHGCPASRTHAIINYGHMPSLITRISDTRFTWTHSSPVYYLSYIYQFPPTLPCWCIDCFCLCYPCVDAVPVSFHARSLVNVLLPVPASSLQRQFMWQLTRGCKISLLLSRQGGQKSEKAFVL